jgi:hypothetical protein
MVPPVPTVQPETLPLVEEDEHIRAMTERRRSMLDRSRRWDEEDDDATPYVANAPEIAPEERAPPELVKPKASEMRLLSRRETPREPKRVWSFEVLRFLGEPTTMGIVFWLSFLCGVVGGFLRIARAFTPAAGEPG